MLDEKLHHLMTEYGVPGVAVGIWHDGKETFTADGVTNIAHPLPVDADTLFQIGSTTKTFTATVAMQLAQAGRLDLHTPIRHYLPEFRLQDAEATANATLAHCFTHTGGWLGDYFDDTGDGDDALARYVEAMTELPQLTPLGSIWSYNNAGFCLAGRVIERVTGQPFEQAAQELLLQPLGMEQSFFFAKEAITHRVAVGHTVDDALDPTVAQPWALARSAHAAGGIISTARDQLRYARFHLGLGIGGNVAGADGVRPLDVAAVRAMQQPLAAAGSMAESVGVSWLLRKVGGVQTVAHGGATNGQLSAFLLVPEREFAITVLTNANRGRELHRDLVDWALAHYLGLHDPEPTILARTPAELADVAGRYEARMSHLEVTVAADGLRVHTTPRGGFPHKDSPAGPTPPPSLMAFVGEDRLRFVAGPARGGRAEIVRDEAGQIAWLRVGGRIHRRVE